MQTIGAILWVIPDIDLLPQPPRRPQRPERRSPRRGLRSLMAALGHDMSVGAEEAARFLLALRGYPY